MGPDFIVGLRYTGDEARPGGTTKDEGLEISRKLKDSGLIDFLNVVRGHIDTDAGLTDLIPIQGMRNAPHLDFAGEIRAATGFPTFHAAKIPDVATARHAIASGKLDMVGMTRAHIADPHIVRKIVEGREDDIRPCVGANYCLDRIYQGGMALCLHNPATGRELTEPQTIPPAPRRKAGDHCRRGSRRHGGRARRRRARPRSDGLRSRRRARRSDPPDGASGTAARDDLDHPLALRAVRETRRLVPLQHLRRRRRGAVPTDPDEVIVATGGLPHTEVLAQGDDLVCSAWDILSGDVKPGTSVLVYDDAGDHAGLQAADVISATGARVEIVTPDRSFAPEVMAMNLVPYMRALQGRDTTFTVTWRLIAVTRDGNQLRATLGSDYGAVTRDRVVDQVVVNHGTRPLDDLYFDLKPLSSNLGEVDYEALSTGGSQTLAPNPDGRFRLFRIGDAVAARNTHAAIYDALRILKDL